MLKSTQIFIMVIKSVQISTMEAIKFRFIQIFIKAIVFIQISIMEFIQIFIKVPEFIQIFIEVLKFIQIFIREVIKVMLTFNQISITFDIKALFPIMGLFLLKDMKVIGIISTRVSIKLIMEEYK